jgi:hypothetical protein
MQRARLLAKSLTFAILVVLITQPNAHAAAPKPGNACKKAGLTQKGNGVVYLCKKSGKKLVWVIALGVKKTPFPTPSPQDNSQVAWNWMDNQGMWVANGTPPQCTLPIIPTGALLDFTKPISILQPGQTRGGSYKPHGGLRWSTYGTYLADTKITVPFDGAVVQAFQYIEAGTYQFGLNIQSPCGFMVRLDHLYVPSAQFSQILKTIPAAVKDDSREMSLNPPVQVHVGDVIAIGVGMPPPAGPDSLGTFIDFGLLDLRHANPAVPANFSSAADQKYSRYSVCWYQNGYLSTADQSLAQKLPYANSDSTSAYCSK